MSSSASVISGKTEKGLKAKEARDLILRVPLLQLNKSAVNVREVQTSGETAEASVGVRVAFRFRKNKDGRLSVVEVRSGDRQWEAVDLIARSLKVEGEVALLADLESLATELAAKQAEAKKAEQQEVRQEEKEDKEAAKENVDEQAGEKKELEKKEPEEKELRRGVFLVKDASALVSSSLLEAEVETSFRFVKEGGRKWRVASVKVGGGEWQNTDALAAALNAEKNARARAELQTLRAALEAFRSERGFYVVAEDQTVLVDHLSPRYLERIVRIDPWHRPYRYRGTRDRYVLTSDGADGKEATADDVTP